MSHSIPWESHQGDLKKVIFKFFTQKKIFLIFISRAPKSKNGLFLEVEKLPAWVFAFLASKGFLTSVGKHVIFQSAWPPAREAALIAGKGFLSRMLQHVFLDIISLDAWIVVLITTEKPLPWMCCYVLFDVTPLREGRGTMGAIKWHFPWMVSIHVPFENMCPRGGIFALLATIRLFFGFACGF